MTSARYVKRLIGRLRAARVHGYFLDIFWIFHHIFWKFETCSMITNYYISLKLTTGRDFRLVARTQRLLLFLLCPNHGYH